MTEPTFLIVNACLLVSTFGVGIYVDMDISKRTKTRSKT